MPKVNGVHFEERGKGFPIFLGHSVGLDHAMWDAQIAALAPSFRVLALDLPGHGRSDTKDEPRTLEEFAGELLAVADTLKIPRFGYAGLSLGGMVGMRMALAAPGRIAALALLDTSAEAEQEEFAESGRGMLEIYRQMGPTEASMQIMTGLFLRQEFIERRPDIVARITERLKTNNVAGIYQASLAVAQRASIVDRLRRIDAPTLVLVGADDIATPPAQAQIIRNAISGAQYVEIPECAHLSTLEQPEKVSQALVSFFKRTLPC